MWGILVIKSNFRYSEYESDIVIMLMGDWKVPLHIHIYSIIIISMRISNLEVF